MFQIKTEAAEDTSAVDPSVSGPSVHQQASYTQSYRVFPGVPCQWIPAGMENLSSTSTPCSQLSWCPESPCSLCCPSFQGHHMYTETGFQAQLKSEVSLNWSCEATTGTQFQEGSPRRTENRNALYGLINGSRDDLASCQLQNHTSIFHQTEAGADAQTFQRPLLSDFQKRELRLLKNREAARECRRKKKEYVRCLENRVAMLENLNQALIEEIRSFKDIYQQNME